MLQDLINEVGARCDQVYCFVLLGHGGNEIMSTEVDECDPRIDAEFWDRFLEGDCTMQYTGTKTEEV